jgi:hypothetical protein
MDSSMLLVIMKLSLFFGPLLVGFIGFGINCYIACRDLDLILNNFKGSYVITYYGDLLGGGSFFTRCILASIVSGGVLWPDKHVLNGSLDSEELARLPTSIKLRMKWSAGLMCSGFVLLFSVVVVSKFLKWLAEGGLDGFS